MNLLTPGSPVCTGEGEAGPLTGGAFLPIKSLERSDSLIHSPFLATAPRSRGGVLSALRSSSTPVMDRLGLGPGELERLEAYNRAVIDEVQ
jgi:hypothetical protein